jgi:hypothetical protein
MLLLGNIEDFMRYNNHTMLSFPKYICMFFTKFIWALPWFWRLFADLTSGQSMLGQMFLPLLGMTECHCWMTSPLKSNYQHIYLLLQAE